MFNVHHSPVQDPNSPPTRRWHWINQFTMFWRRLSHRSGYLHRSDSRHNLYMRKTCWFKSADVWQNFWLGFFYRKSSDFKQKFCIRIFNRRNREKDISSQRCWALYSQNQPDRKTLNACCQLCVSRMLSQSTSPTESEPGSLGSSELLQTFSVVVNVCTLQALDPQRRQAVARF